jgi:hypothetical protein
MFLKILRSPIWRQLLKRMLWVHMYRVLPESKFSSPLSPSTPIHSCVPPMELASPQNKWEFWEITSAQLRRLVCKSEWDICKTYGVFCASEFLNVPSDCIWFESSSFSLHLLKTFFSTIVYDLRPFFEETGAWTSIYIKKALLSLSIWNFKGDMQQMAPRCCN